MTSLSGITVGTPRFMASVLRIHNRNTKSLPRFHFLLCRTKDDQTIPIPVLVDSSPEQFRWCFWAMNFTCHRMR